MTNRMLRPSVRGLMLLAAALLVGTAIPTWLLRHRLAAAVRRAVRGNAATLLITRGGTYTGTWQSDDPDVPVVLIKTAEPVVIDRSTLRGRGTLIATGVDHADVTVRDCRGFGLNPNVAGKAPGRFFSGEFFDNVVIENNQLEHTSGIYLNSYRGGSSPGHAVRIVRNRARNIDGRKSDGRGGYLDFNSRRRADGSGDSEDGFEIAQFVQLDKVRHLRGIEIAWNEVINEPGRSRVEDNINIFQSSGAPDSPILIHDNYIRGAYTISPAQPDSADGEWKYTWSYSGGGILLADGSSDTLEGAAGFVRAYDNQVLDTTNYGIAVSAGHDCTFYNNRILSAGVLADGRAIAAQNVGAYIWDSHKDAANKPPTFFNNSGRDNLIGWMKGRGRNDWWVPDAKDWSNNTAWPGSLAAAAYAGEWEAWQKKLETARVVVGPRDPAPAAPDGK